MGKKSRFGQKKRHGLRTVPCPSGNREHGWEGKMPPIYILSTTPPDFFNANNKKNCILIKYLYFRIVTDYSSRIMKSIEIFAL